MALNPLDRSNYFKGLLILIGKDREISDSERGMMKKLAEILGFNQKFVETAINELFENQYILEDPPLFSSQVVAQMFIKDGMHIAFIDKVLHLYELQWLLMVSQKNQLSKDWFYKQLNQYMSSLDSSMERILEIQKFLDPIPSEGLVVYN